MNIAIDAHQLDDLSALWEQAPDLLREELLAATEEAELLLVREIKEDTPRGATGTLAASIHGEAPVVLADSVIGVVGTSAAHALPVELGSRPHFPPLDPLIDWVKAKLDIRDEDQAYGAALAIARKIAARGTLAVGMFHRNVNQHQDQIGRMYQAAQGRVVERLSHV